MTDTGHCGTIYGRDLHYKAGEPACDDCKAAARDWQHKRRSDPDAVAVDRARASARARALTRLRHLYPDVFEELYRDEKKRDES